MRADWHLNCSQVYGAAIDHSAIPGAHQPSALTRSALSEHALIFAAWFLSWLVGQTPRSFASGLGRSSEYGHCRPRHIIGMLIRNMDRSLRHTGERFWEEFRIAGVEQTVEWVIDDRMPPMSFSFSGRVVDAGNIPQAADDILGCRCRCNIPGSLCDVQHISTRACPLLLRHRISVESI